MADSDAAIQAARADLIRLFEADDWKITHRAETDGRAVLQSRMAFPTQYAIIDFVLDLLRADYPMHEIQRGQPRGSLGVGYVMNVDDNEIRDLYVELIIEDDTAWVISFHPSKHAKKT